MDIRQILSDMAVAPGVSGNEPAVSRVIEGLFRKYTDDVWGDTFGNLYARMGQGSPVIAVAAHMDEIGMMVNKLYDNGMIGIGSVAGVDPRVLPGSRVMVWGREPVQGVVGALPPHLMAAGDGKKAYKMEELVCDIGYPREQTEALVAVGDFVSFWPEECIELGGGYLASKTMDDRALVTAELCAMEELSRVRLNCTVIFVASVQEECGMGGARTLAWNARPDFAIAMDVTHGAVPGVDASLFTPMDAVDVTVGSNIHPGVADMIVAAAKKRNIKYQISACMGATGTDAWGIQTAVGGIPCGLISPPLRYMHTSVEVIDPQTLKNCGAILAQVAIDVGADWEEKLCWKD